MLLSIVLGLAVSDLCVSLNRLLDAGARVKWDWLSPLAALVALLKIVTQWWAWFYAAPLAKAVTFEMFVLVLASAVLLYMLAAAALPDSVEPGVDLRAYYARTSRRYWLLFFSQSVLSNAVGIWAQLRAPGAKLSLVALGYPGFLIAAVTFILAAAVGLAIWRNRIAHTAAFAGLIAIYLLQFGGRGLGQ